MAKESVQHGHIIYSLELMEISMPVEPGQALNEGGTLNKCLTPTGTCHIPQLSPFQLARVLGGGRKPRPQCLKGNLKALKHGNGYAVIFVIGFADVVTIFINMNMHDF